MSLEKLLTIIRSHSMHGNYFPMEEFIFADTALNNTMIVDDLIRNLDIQTNTVAILFLLCRQLKNDIRPKHLISQIIDFINDCNEDQIKHANFRFASLCHELTDYLVAENQPLKGLKPLSKAIRKAQKFSSQLTSIHSDLCKLAILSKCMNPALVFLDIDITDINQENENSDVQYFLLYYYYGGMIYCMKQNYERSFLFFQTATSVTGSAISQICIEAYKKYILVSLLQYGKLIPPISKQIGTYIFRSIRPFCRTYMLIVNGFNNNSIETLDEILNKYSNEFQEDLNIGLVKQVISSLIKVKIQKLTKTFMTLSLKDMANKVTVQSTEIGETKILHMIENGEIYALINQKDGMVKFADNPEKYNSLYMYKMIEQQINKCITLNEKLKQLDQDIMLNPKYICKTRNDYD